MRGSRHYGAGHPDDESIGSSIPPADQFDILVRKKDATAMWKFMGDHQPGETDTDVSSITTEDNRYRSFRAETLSYQATSTSSSSFCCCSTIPTESGPTDNTLITSRAPPPTDTAVIYDRYAVPITKNNTTSENCLMICCPAEQTAACPVKNSPRNASQVSMCSLNRGTSLFDILLDEDEQDYFAQRQQHQEQQNGMRRFGKSLRRAIPWKKKQIAE